MPKTIVYQQIFIYLCCKELYIILKLQRNKYSWELTNEQIKLENNRKKSVGENCRAKLCLLRSPPLTRPSHHSLASFVFSNPCTNSKPYSVINHKQSWIWFSCEISLIIKLKTFIEFLLLGLVDF